MILLIDIGNTRIKWASLKLGVLGPQSAEVHAGADRSELIDRIFASDLSPTRVLISNVGGPEIEAACTRATKQRFGVDAEVIRSSAEAGGVTNAYREPLKLGTDRWLSVIAAHAMQRGAACVVSVGTAMTIDGVDAAGRHLGGVIVPGPELMVSSLLKNTSDIARRMSQDEVHPGVFATHTLGAVHQGCTHALAALIERAFEEMLGTLGSRPLLLMTGGASAQVAALLREPHEFHADLVLRGLTVIATKH